MSDYEALFGGVLENPEDDTPRLVLADWLEENGQSVRAQTIRDQIGTANRARAIRDKGRNDVADLLELQQRIACHSIGESLAYGWETDADHDAYYGIHRIGSRGFISVVRCWLGEWVGSPCIHCRWNGRLNWNESCDLCPAAHGPRIVASHPIERVEIMDLDALFQFETRRMNSRGPGQTILVGVNADKLPDGFSRQFPATGSTNEMAKYIADELLAWARREANLPPLRISNLVASV